MKKYKIVSGANFADRKKLTKSLNSIITKSWGSFGSKYVDKHITRADFLVLSLYRDKIVGFASANKYLIKNKEIYYLEFTAILPEHQGFGLSKKMNEKIFRMIILNSLRHLKLSFIIMTISPNPRILGLISRTSQKFYPNPRSDALVPKEIWIYIESLVTKLGDPYTKLERKGSVIEGFYNDYGHLVYDPLEVPKDKDNLINLFSKKYLKFDQGLGREFVIYAEYRLSDFIKERLRNV